MANEITDPRLSDRAVVSRNGTLRDATTGRIIGLDRQVRAEWEAERRRKAQQAAEAGLRDGLGTPNKFEAWRRIIAAQAQLAADPEAKAASTNAAKFVGEQVFGNQPAQQDEPGRVTNVLIADGGILLEKLLRVIDS